MTTLWRSACDLEPLQQRAKLYTIIRQFFNQKAVLEVETPLLCQATGTDPQLDFFSSKYHCPPNDQTMYLQTSPEFAMKRLLASGSGSIFQICKAFRNAESGRLHNPEFSILEWYRVGFDLDQLIDEVIELLVVVLNMSHKTDTVIKVSYAHIFEQVTGLDPLVFCQESYQRYAKDNAIYDAVELCGDDHSLWLDFIFSYQVQPTLIDKAVYIVYGYPAIQSSLARINKDNPATADRFEVFIKGVEIGNGFFELADAKEQESRFDQENKKRQLNGSVLVKKDYLFLDALNAGLPDCSGVAIGLDRLLMIITNKNALNDVIAFPLDRA